MVVAFCILLAASAPILTAIRIFMVPLLVVILLTGRFPDREIWGLVVLVAAAVTDYFDGFLARRRHQVTAMGKLLDPIADKILLVSCFNTRCARFASTCCLAARPIRCDSVARYR